MAPKKPRYSSSLSTAWVVPSVSRPGSRNEPDSTESDTAETPGDHETGRSSTSASRSKYTSTLPSSWIIPSLLNEPHNESKDHLTKPSNGKRRLPIRVPLGVPDWDVSASLPQNPHAPVESHFPQNRGRYGSEPKTTLRDHGVEHKQNREKASKRASTNPAAALQPSLDSPSAQTALSSTSASGSCDLPAGVPRVSPSYSVL